MTEKIYIEREPRVKCFLGDQDPEKVQAFESEVRRAWKFIPEEDEVRRQDVILSNIGPAVHVELSCQDPKTQETSSKLLDLIVKIYGESRSPLELLQVLLQQKQGPDDVVAYSHRLKRLFTALTRRQLQLGEVAQSEQTLRDQFILGLSDLHLRRTLKERVKVVKDVSFQAIRETAREYVEDTEGPGFAAAALAQCPKRHTSEPKNSAPPAMVEVLPQLLTFMGSMQTAMEGVISRLDKMGGPSDAPVKNKGPPRRDFICYGCGEKGHYKRNCPKAKPQL